MDLPHPDTGPALYPPTVSPTEGPLPLGRFIWQFVQNPLRALPTAVYHEPIVVYRPAGTIGVCWITGPELIEGILGDRSGLYRKTQLEERVLHRAMGQGVLTADGSDWLWQRRVLAPLFRHSELLSYVPKMVAAADEEVGRWRGASATKVAIDTAMVDVTFRIIARTMLAGGEPAEGATLKRAGARYLGYVPLEMAAVMLRLPRWLPHPGNVGLALAARQMRRAVGRIITRRRALAEAGPAIEGDLLGRLLAARHPDTGAPMDDERLIDNLLTLLEAGHETTARALSWTLYLLARAPEWQERVRAEVEDVTDGTPVGPDHIDRLAITERVIKEAMRLYPPAPVVARSPTRAIEIRGWELAADSEIVIPIFAVHRHRALWDDPDRFDPDRFLPERERGYSRTQYMPFGAGQRICLGQAFAMIEAKALLATFVRAARFDWDGHHLPEPVSRITLKPKGGMPLLVTSPG